MYKKESPKRGKIILTLVSHRGSQLYQLKRSKVIEIVSATCPDKAANYKMDNFIRKKCSEVDLEEDSPGSHPVRGRDLQPPTLRHTIRE